MYIQPNTTVRLLTGVPLDNTYAHTLYFSDKASQTSYFESKTKAGCLLSNLSYQRYTKGSLRIQKLADDIYDCNYMMFKNTAYGNKWFYAFINNIEYISNTVCEITYEIDVIQTWFFDVTLLQSFVEREHSATDEVGENIIPEPVNIGDYFLGAEHSTGLFYTYDYVIVSPYKVLYEGNIPLRWVKNFSTQVVDRNPTMLTHTAIKHDMSALTDWFAVLIGNLADVGDIEEVVDCYVIPRPFLDDPNYTYTQEINSNLTAKEFEYYADAPTTLSHGYKPKNNKLLTYPYNKFVINTNDGNIYDFAFEFFEKNNDGKRPIDFLIYGYRGGNLSFKACPRNYKGEGVNYSSSVLLTDFPPIPYIIDSYRAWLAQNKTRIAFQMASSTVPDIITGMNSKTPRTRVWSAKGKRETSGGFKEIGEVLSEFADRSVGSLKASGSSSGSLEIAMGEKDFKGIQYSVNPQNARIIDDFFNCYGYATHRVKVPNRNVRPHWTYVKTIDINLESNAPSDDTSKIASIYDNGITFWRHSSEVGNYSLDNSPS